MADLRPLGRDRGGGRGICRVCGRVVFRTGKGLAQRHRSEAQDGECRGGMYAVREEVTANA